MQEVMITRPKFISVVAVLVAVPPNSHQLGRESANALTNDGRRVERLPFESQPKV